MAVDFAEENGSPKDQFGEDGSLVAVRTLRCAWDDRYLLIDQVGTDGGEDYPHLPNYGCRAVGAAIEGRGQITEYSLGIAQYEHALITVRYSTYSPTKFLGGRFVTEEFQPSGENRRLDPTDLRWLSPAGGPLKPLEAPSYLHGTFDYVLTFHDLITIPAAAIMMNVQNSVAMTAFIFPLVFSIGTLRHLRPEISHTVGLGLQDRFRLTYRWTYNDQTWSRFQAGNGAWGEVWNVAGGQLQPYTPFDMRQMYP